VVLAVSSILKVHTYHDLQTEMRDQMIRAYRERMESDIGIKADVSFIDQWNKEAEIGVEFDAHDVVENVQDNPGYDRFRERHRQFFKTRTDDWWKRFHWEP
jgi:hypothetical protein